MFPYLLSFTVLKISEEFNSVVFRMFLSLDLSDCFFMIKFRLNVFGKNTAWATCPAQCIP